MMRILYLEDDEIEVFRMKRASKGLSSNLEISFADSFKKANSLIGETKYDVIITDHNLLDGKVTDNPDLFGKTPVVLVSGMEGHQLKLVADEIGAIECFAKPVNFSQILGFLDKWLLPMETNAADKADTDQTAAFDPSVLDNATGGDLGLQLELTEMFFEKLKGDLQQSRVVFEEGDSEKLKHIVHNLKPTLTIFGQNALSELCKSIETQLLDGAEMSAIKERLEQLEIDGAAFLDTLKKYLSHN